MKIAKVLIENFRRIERLELDFTDSLDRVRPMTVLVGPNGCGKTSVLDAIATALSPTLELPGRRSTLELDPRRIVRRGAPFARVTCNLRFSADEIALTRELLARLGNPQWLADDVPTEQSVKFQWTYPDPQNTFRMGRTETSPLSGWMLLKGRVSAARLLRTAPSGQNWFQRVGQVTTIDQQRTSTSRIVSNEVMTIVRGGGTEDDANRPQRTDDPRLILLDLALKHAVPKSPGTDDLFVRVRDGFNAICAPRTLVGAINVEGGFDVRFNDGVSDYGFDDVASGEAMILLMLIKLAGERIHRSIVLVDEVELHQHPVWQRRLVNALPSMGDDNQFILTTHSDYLLASFGPESIVRFDAPHMVKLGALDAEEDDAP